MANQPKGEVVVDSRGRCTLLRVRTQAHDRYLVTEHPDGTLVLTPAITLTPAELAKLQAARLGPVLPQEDGS